MGLTLGQIVISKAGRDEGRRFVVVEVLNELYVLLADGDLRKCEKPKKKKIRHIIQTGMVAAMLEEKLKNGEKITNSDLKRALKEKEYTLEM
ncbi:MAG: RNA-binding protein [Clostridiales bacterium]|nr:RNA-binding protein [Clostridiales bacterium]